MGFYVQTYSALHVAGPFPDVSGAVDRAIAIARMRASRGDVDVSGVIVESTGLGPETKTRDVATWRYLKDSGDLQRVEVRYANDPERPTYFDRDGATS